MEKDEINRNDSFTKPRKAWIALLLSILTPGLGQVYNGQIGKAITVYVLLYIPSLIFGYFRLSTVFCGLLFLFSLEITLRLYAIVDAFIQAKRLKSFEPRVYNRWYFYVIIVFAMISVTLVTDISKVLGIQPIYNGSYYLEPSIQYGDYVIVDNQYDDAGGLDYGDVVYSDGFTKSYLKYNPSFYRIVGVPGDSIVLQEGRVIINSILYDYEFVEEKEVSDKDITIHSSSLPNGRDYEFCHLQNPPIGVIRDQPLTVVAANSYYLIGDHRDCSFDSRMLGAVPKSKIIGKVAFIYFGKSLDRINVDFNNY